MKTTKTKLEGGTELAAAQLGMQADGLQLKMDCAIELNDRLDKLNWKQDRIGRELGLSQPHVSELRNYRLDRFSADRLLQFMAALGLDVNISIRVPATVDEPASETNIKVAAARKAVQKAA